MTTRPTDRLKRCVPSRATLIRERSLSVNSSGSEVPPYKIKRQNDLTEKNKNGTNRQRQKENKARNKNKSRRPQPYAPKRTIRKGHHHNKENNIPNGANTEEGDKTPSSTNRTHSTSRKDLKDNPPPNSGSATNDTDLKRKAPY